MRWLFVIGVALEIAGALLISLPLVLPALQRRWSEFAVRSHLYPWRVNAEYDVEEPTYAIVGGISLLVGFVLQLAGYVDQFQSEWLILLGAGFGVAIGAVLLGRFLLVPALSRWMLDKARDTPASPERRIPESRGERG